MYVMIKSCMTSKQLLERIVQLRKRAKLSCKELSKRIDRQEHYIARVEKGVYPIPPAEDLDRIARVCGSSMEELFYETFDSYYEDKEILEKFKKITSENSKNALIGLLVLLYEKDMALSKKQ